MQAIAIPQHRWTVLYALTGLLLPASLAGQQVERYALAGDEVVIYNLAGEIRVEPGPGPDVIAELTRGGAEAGRVKVMKSERDGRETLRLVYPGDRIRYGKLNSGSSTQLRVRDDGTFGDDDHDGKGKKEGRQVTISAQAGGVDAYGDLRIKVPAGRSVAVYLAAGRVAVTKVEGDLTVDVASAPVTSSSTRGELNIDVGSGAVQVNDSRGELSIDTGSGTVALLDVRGERVSVQTGSGEVTATDIRSSELKIETGSGDIRVGNLVASHVSLQTGSGAVTADVGGELWDVDVQTGSGDVTLRVPATLSAEVDFETSSGDIETDFPVQVTRHARDHMTGRIGDGQGKIEIETGSGGIKLVKAQ
jgi:lia operon protein LiaG